MKRLQPTILACIAAFIAGFVLSWVIKPAEVQIIEKPTAPITANSEVPAASSNATAASENSNEPAQTEAAASDESTATSEDTSSDASASEYSNEAAQTGADVSVDGLIWSGSSAVQDPLTGASVSRDGQYTSRDEVALYIYAFGDVPSNYITKSQARREGWVASEGNLWDVAPGMSIGGGGFENLEGEIPLPYDPDRTFKECDINYEGGYRGAERLVWSDDGYIFYTPDHYESFEQLYPHEEA